MEAPESGRGFMDAELEIGRLKTYLLEFFTSLGGEPRPDLRVAALIAKARLEGEPVE